MTILDFKNPPQIQISKFGNYLFSPIGENWMTNLDVQTVDLLNFELRLDISQSNEPKSALWKSANILMASN